MAPGRGLYCFVTVLGALLASAAHAQVINASSGENIVADTHGVDRATIGAHRNALFLAMLGDPSNLDLAFEYAALSEQAGDIEAAISTLERMLVFAPGLPRLQFELGVLYYRLNSWNTAKAYFTAVLAQPQLPDDIRTRIGQYMKTIEEQESGLVTVGVAGVGIRYQTNANAGPSSPIVDLGGIDFELDPGALGHEDWNGYVAGRYYGSIDLENQGDRFDFDLRGYGALYAEQTDLNTGIVELELGPDFNLGGLGLDNVRLALHGDFDAALLGGDPYIASAGLGADLSLVLNARTKLTLESWARHNQYFDSDLRPSSAERTGQVYGGGPRLEYLLTPGLAVYVSLDLNRTNASAEYFSSWEAGATTGLVWSFDGPGDGGPWSLNLGAGIQAEQYDSPDPAMMASDAEQTTLSFASAGLSVPLAEQLVLTSTVTYSVSDSNYDLSNWDNVAASVGLNKGF